MLLTERFNLHNVKIMQRDGAVWKRVWLQTLLTVHLTICVQLTRKLCAVADQLRLTQLMFEWKHENANN
jgi:hypothetical protein